MRECVYGVSHLPIFSSTHKPLAYLLDIYYTRKAVFSQANSPQNPRDWSDERRNPLLSHGPAAVGKSDFVNLLFLSPDFADFVCYFLLKDFDEAFVFVDDFLLGLYLGNYFILRF